MAVAESLINGAIVSGVFFFRDYLLGFTWRCEKSDLQKKVDRLANEMGVKIPIGVYENDSYPWMAHGCVFYRKAAITVPTEKLSDNTVTAVLAHEIAHIKHNDAAWFTLILTVSTVAFVYIGLLILAPLVPFVVKNLIVNGCTLFVLHLRSVSQEEKADEEALQYLNAEQKKAFIQFFEEVREKNLRIRKYAENNPGLMNSIVLLLINSKGETLKGRLTHPTLESRIAKISKSLESEPARYRRFSLWEAAVGA